MNSKGQVLTCVGEEWTTALHIARETAFVYKAEYTDAHVVMVALLLIQLRGDRLVDEHDFGDEKSLNVYRLSSLGKVRHAELIANNPDIIRRQEDFLLSGCPT